MREAELVDSVHKIVASNEKVQASIEKAMKRKRNTVYTAFLRLLTLLVLVGCIYTALIGFAGSAAVLGAVFLMFWFFDRVAAAIVGGFKGWSDGKAKELELELEKRRPPSSLTSD